MQTILGTASDKDNRLLAVMTCWAKRVIKALSAFIKVTCCPTLNDESMMNWQSLHAYYERSGSKRSDYTAKIARAIYPFFVP